jgi:hypothetical protein
MTEFPRTWLAHTLPAKSDIGQGQATSPGSRLRRGLPGLPQWLKRDRVGTKARGPDPTPLTVAGPRRIHTDFRAPVPVKLLIGFYWPPLRCGKGGYLLPGESRTESSAAAPNARDTRSHSHARPGALC